MLVVQNRNQPARVLDTISTVIPESAEEIVVAAAYVTRSGTSLIFDRLRKKLGVEGFQNAAKCLITTCDYGLTDPDALDDWRQAGAQVLMANSGSVVAGNLNPSTAYHPKVYAFRSVNAVWQVVCGSANLTSRGLTINSEAVASSTLDDEAMQALIQQLADNTTEVDDQLIQQYRALRQAMPPPAPVAKETNPVPPPEPRNGALTWFGDAVAGGGVDPSEFERMWVQTLTMSGGSGSQLELPRGANGFFGFNFANYAQESKVTIGTPPLISGRNRWTDRILSWHGNNRMERMNMPTPAMSGYTYAHSAICFKRITNGYEFVAAPWDSDLARSWRTASIENDHLYKVGEHNSPRVCGLL